MIFQLLTFLIICALPSFAQDDGVPRNESGRVQFEFDLEEVKRPEPAPIKVIKPKPSSSVSEDRRR